MPDGDFKTVFELGLGSFPWAALSHPLIFIAVGILFIRFLKNKRPYLVMGFTGASIGSIFFLLLLITDVPKFVGSLHEYSSGKSVVVAGIVQDYHPAPANGPSVE